MSRFSPQIPLSLPSMHLTFRPARRPGMGRRQGPSLVRGARALFSILILLALTFVSFRADAHAIGLSTGEYTAKGASVVGKMAFARGEVAALVPTIDANKDGHLSAAEVESSRAALEAKIVARIDVKTDGASCKASLTDAALTEQDGLVLQGRWDCPTSEKAFDVDLPLLDDLAHGHRHVARAISGAAMHDEVLFRDHRSFTIAPDMTNEAAATPVPSPSAHHGTGAWAFFKMGIEHILTGYDHLVFLLGLVLARARVRSLLTIVTAFTVAHSITLAIAVLGVWAPSSRIVEPAIALSIAYVGIENFFVKDAEKRWRITFPFGLIHGFGFAGALQEINLPKSSIPTALVSFNLGVEAGQLAVMALVLPLILFLREKSWFEARAVKIVSGAVALAGSIWFVTRVVG
jgi:hydrogenase/urease accessory protein HupE